MVDWSAAAVPTRGADSIWLAVAQGGRTTARNLATRREAEDALADLIGGGSGRLLIGLDFPFGYPLGAAAIIGGGGWQGVWARLAELVEDGPQNANNRFEVAARLNRAFGPAPGPFWGHPPGRRYDGLGATRAGIRYGDGLPPERRLVERAVPRAQPCWKLAYTGSVGSQALTGIAMLARLRRRLPGALSVWPFETGLAAPAAAAGAPAVLAEVYPSLLGAAVARGQARGEVKDRAQVRLVATALARLDAAGDLGPLFAGPPGGLAAEDRRTVETEEAWILGAGHADALAAALDLPAADAPAHGPG